MLHLRENVFLVVPCYNEAARLDLSQLALLDDSCRLLFVNDGSTDRTAELIARHCSEHVHLLNLKTNSGKAEAVRQGMLHLPALPGFDSAQWVGYWDADFSTPLAELQHFFAYAGSLDPDAEAVWGSRVRMLGCRINRHRRRHLFGRVFATSISLLLNMKCYDTQCGAKLFRKHLLAPAFSDPFISRWVFDVEILLRLQGHHDIIECPLREWHDVPGSKISFFRDAGRILSDLARIRRRYGPMRTP